MTSQNYAETVKRFNSATQNIANSNRNDDVTRLATEHTNTLSKMHQLGEEKAYHENMAKSYQDSYSRASNLTVSERMNLRDYAIEIAGQENISPREASMILDSNRPEDQAQKNRWFSVAQSQERARKHPTMPMMKQPINWGNLNKQTAQNEMRQEFNKAKQAINNDFAKHQAEMTKQKKDLSSAIKENESQIDSLKKAIELIERGLINQAESIEQARQLGTFLNEFAKGFELLDDYDHEKLDKKGRTKSSSIKITLEEFLSIIQGLKKDFDSEVFGIPKDESFESSVNQIYQGFGEEECYPTIEEKAATLLYLVVKNHSFIDGNKRIAAACFLYFLEKNGILKNNEKFILDSNTLFSLTILIAKSKSSEMELVKNIVITILNRSN